MCILIRVPTSGRCVVQIIYRHRRGGICIRIRRPDFKINKPRSDRKERKRCKTLVCSLVLTVWIWNSLLSKVWASRYFMQAYCFILFVSIIRSLVKCSVFEPKYLHSTVLSLNFTFSIMNSVPTQFVLLAYNNRYLI